MSSSIALLVALQLSGMALAPVTLPEAALPAPFMRERLVDRRIDVPLVRGADGRAAAPRAAGVEYSEWYYRRLDIHRWGSYAMLPLFLAQYYAGTQLEQNGEENWAADLHPALAGGVAALFASNTVTGVWNLYEGRKDPTDRKRRFLHASLMLLADAGFVATGILADETEDGGDASAHKTMAIASMSVATLGWVIMLDLFRPD